MSGWAGDPPRPAVWPYVPVTLTPEEIREGMRRAVAAEREACAELMDERCHEWHDLCPQRKCRAAEAIRARGADPA